MGDWSHDDNSAHFCANWLALNCIVSKLDQGKLAGSTETYAWRDCSDYQGWTECTLLSHLPDYDLALPIRKLFH